MSGVVALVTGGIGGLGTEMCKALSLQGQKVYANHLPGETDLALQWQKALKSEGFEIGLAAGNVADFDSSGEMIAKIQAESGSPIQILVNCAGITRDATLKKMTKEFWDAVISTNLTSLYNVTSQVIEAMMESGFGRVVNISSVNGQTGQFGQTNYSAAKAGVHGFTMALARETARKGVTVNSISPGYIETPMALAVPQEVRDKIVATIPIGRMGQPAEIGAVVGFLCSEAAAYITGANIPVNGGLHMEF
jgi:acetoacetyl-CoA reductase